MAEVITKTLNTRIALKYDLYTNWSTNNPILLKGEVALAYIPADATLNEGGAVVAGTTPPNVMMKIGDGTHHYNDLKFISALAADVAAWAKAAVKPEYTAEEIKGLADYINTEIQDTDTQYSLVKVTDYQYKLMSKTLEEESFTTEVGVINIPKYDDTTVKADIAANTAAIALLNGEVGTAGSVKKSIADAIAALNLASTYAPLVHTHTKSEITDFAHTHEMGEVNGLADALAGKEASGAAAQALADAKTYADGKDAETLAAAKEDATSKANAAQAAAEATAAADATSKANAAEAAAKSYADGKAAEVQGNVDTLAGKVGTLPTTTDATTVVEYIDKKTANVADNGTVEALAGRVGTLETGLEAVTKDYLKGADKNELQGNINTVSQAVTDEAARAVAKENEIAGALDAYKTTTDGRLDVAEADIDALQETVLGLTGAMHFKGAVDAVPADGAEGYVSGDVVVVTTTHKEYVYDGAAWHELGDEGSHITKTEVANTYETKVDAGTKLTEAKTYAEQQASAAQAAAEATAAADATAKANAAQAAAEATAAADATSKANTALADAKKYADEKDAENLGTAKTYAEQKASEAQTAAVNTAAADATSKANTALADAKKYADEKDAETLAAAKEDAASKASAAETAAKSYADGLDAAMKERMAAVEAKPAMGLTAENITDYNEAVALADTAVQNVTADTGLKATRTGNDIVMSIDEAVTFVFECGTSAI